ncbi:MAG: hypothetical protein DCC75_11110 [Proteobacteria bacterium]|nr:MAG: hypothetical protein DCC75_11110 [Pseudomonadota bacterium]
MSSTAFIRFNLLAFLALAALLPEFLNAETLQDVINSKGFRRYRNTVHSKSLLSSKYLTPGSNFAKVFTEKNGAHLLLDWLGVLATDYFGGAETSDQEDEYVFAGKILRDKKMHSVNVVVMVPHPIFRTQAESGLIEDFAALVPPKLKVSYITPFEFSGRKGNLYEKEAGGCSLVIPMAKQTIVNLSIDNCREKELLLDLANKLTYNRLDAKLDS